MPKVEVPYFENDATSSTAFDSSTGYSAGNTATSFRKIELTERPFQGLAFTSSEIARQPFLKLADLTRLKTEKLAYDVWVEVLSVVTSANYGAAGLTSPASGFDSEDIADLKLAAKTWPQSGRLLMVDSDYDCGLLKDVTFKNAMAAGSDSAIKEGRLFPRVFGFDYIENPGIPSNGENLVGFISTRSAILFASSPIRPSDDVLRSGTVYEVFTDPQTGVSQEYRRFGNSSMDRAEHYVECNFGYAKGNSNALKRITSA